MSKLVWEVMEYPEGYLLAQWSSLPTLWNVSLMRDGIVTMCVPVTEMVERKDAVLAYWEEYRSAQK